MTLVSPPPVPPIDICRHCLYEVRWTPERGWAHEGGGVWFQRCVNVKCRWYGAPEWSVLVCPGCGQRGTVRTDHCAQPLP